MSFDQLVYREAGECNCGGFEDHQGLGLFMRAGLADRDVNDLGTFWSAGSQYRGVLPGRDCDVLGVGYARGNVSSEAGYTEPHESVLETYYNCWITTWLSVSPSVQYIWHGGADEAVGNATVIGLRAQMFF